MYGRWRWTAPHFSSSKVAATDIAEFARRWSINMSRARTVVSPRRFAVSVQCNTGLDLIFVDASTIAYAREQARAKHGGDVRILATRAYGKGMAEARFDPHGVLAREREAQYDRHALPLAE